MKKTIIVATALIYTEAPEVLPTTAFVNVNAVDKINHRFENFI